jgi:hypothetical protein
MVYAGTLHHHSSPQVRLEVILVVRPHHSWDLGWWYKCSLHLRHGWVGYFIFFLFISHQEETQQCTFTRHQSEESSFLSPFSLLVGKGKAA